MDYFNSEAFFVLQKIYNSESQLFQINTHLH